MKLAQTAGDGATPRHRGGRALDSRRDFALREVVLELLAEVGYDRLTMDAVASRAHASKPTIYRRWRGKAEIVVDALNSVKGVPEAIDKGSLRDDLNALVNSLTNAESRFGAQLTVGMLTALSRDAELRAVFADRFMSPRMAAFRAVFERAVARGEMSAGHDLELLARLVPALALQQLVISGDMPTPAFVRRIVNQIVYPLATAPVAEPVPDHKRAAHGRIHPASARKDNR